MRQRPRSLAGRRSRQRRPSAPQQVRLPLTCHPSQKCPPEHDRGGRVPGALQHLPGRARVSGQAPATARQGDYLRRSLCQCSPVLRPSATRREAQVRASPRTAAGASELNADLATSARRLQRRRGTVHNVTPREYPARARRKQHRERAAHPARCSARSAFVSATQLCSQALRASRRARASDEPQCTARRANRGAVGARGVAARRSRPAAGPTARTAVARAAAHRWRSTSSAQSATRSSATRCSAASAPSNACAMRAPDSWTAGCVAPGRPVTAPCVQPRARRRRAG